MKIRDLKHTPVSAWLPSWAASYQAGDVFPAQSSGPLARVRSADSTRTWDPSGTAHTGRANSLIASRVSSPNDAGSRMPGSRKGRYLSCSFAALR